MAVPEATFSAALLDSLIPEVGTGSYTFARASAASVLDHEGINQRVLSGEARFRRGRRVHNLLQTAGADSANLLDGVWVADGVTINSSTQFTINSTSGIAGPTAVGVYTGDANGRTFRVSFTAYKVSGTSNSFGARLYNEIGSSVNTTVTLTDSPRRYSVLLSIATASTSLDLVMRSAANEIGRVISCTDISIEDVTFQSNQNPSEYVSYGMGDDHGSGVDGVKWFDTANGNTVDGSFVVTEATGVALDVDGYLSHQTRTNKFWPSEDLDHANWTKSNVTIAASSTYLAGIKAQAINNDSVSDVSHHISHSLTALTANGDLNQGMFVKAGTATHAFIRVALGAEYAVQFFNLATGVKGSALDSGGTIGIESGTAHFEAVSGGYLCSVTVDSSSTNNAHTVQFGLSNADGATTYANATLGETLGWMTALHGHIEHEGSDYVPTVTGEVIEQADTLRYSAANLADEMSGVIEINLEHAANSTLLSMWNTTGVQPGYFVDLFGGTTPRLVLWDNSSGTSVRVYRATGPVLDQGTHKIGFTVSRTAGQRALVVNGVAYAATIDDNDVTTWSPNELGISHAEGLGQVDGAVHDVQLWSTPLTVAQLQNLTAS